MPGNPMFILDGPSHATGSLGGFYWFGGLAHNSEVSSGETLRKLDSFYAEVASNPGRIYSGSFYKGFDDGLAPWGEGRKIDQACGLTFIRSLATATKASFTGSSKPRPIQVATWNDYEEGTEVETGIDNCSSVGPMFQAPRSSLFPLSLARDRKRPWITTRYIFRSMEKTCWTQGRLP